MDQKNRTIDENEIIFEYMGDRSGDDNPVNNNNENKKKIALRSIGNAVSEKAGSLGEAVNKKIDFHSIGQNISSKAESVGNTVKKKVDSINNNQIGECIVCGKKLTIINYIDDWMDINETSIGGNNCCVFCGPRLKNLFYTSPLTNDAKKSFSHFEKNMSESYIKDEKLKSSVIERMGYMADVYYFSNNIEKILNSFADNLKIQWDSFYENHPDMIIPKSNDNEIWCGISKNDQCIYYSDIKPSYTEELRKLIIPYEKREEYFNNMQSKRLNLNITAISFEKIQFYKLTGDIKFVSKTNGSGGNVNVEGAVLGGLLFGTAGAIVGSNMNKEVSITSSVEEHDTRRTVIRYRNDDGSILEKEFPADCFIHLVNVLPEKEYASENKKSEASMTLGEKKLSIEESFELIKKLKELLDMGAITQQEFEVKKAQLLNL